MTARCVEYCESVVKERDVHFESSPMAHNHFLCSSGDSWVLASTALGPSGIE